jgi:hypothetical protein
LALLPELNDSDMIRMPKENVSQDTPQSHCSPHQTRKKPAPQKVIAHTLASYAPLPLSPAYSGSPNTIDRSWEGFGRGGPAGPSAGRFRVPSAMMGTDFHVP